MERRDLPASPPAPELMAARRLVIVMLVLLGISALAAALVPTREPKQDTVGSTGTTGTETTGTETQAQTGTAQKVTISVGEKEFPVVPLKLGDQLALVVRTKTSDQVEIPALGMIATAAPEAPAQFDVLPDQAGDLGIRLVSLDRVVARIEVRSGARGASDRPAKKRRREQARS